MLMRLCLLALLFVFHSTSAATTDTPINVERNATSHKTDIYATDLLIRPLQDESQYFIEQVKVLIINDLSDSVTFCFDVRRTVRMQSLLLPGTPLLEGLCKPVFQPQEAFETECFPEDVFSVTSTSPHLSFLITVVGGQHVYKLSQHSKPILSVFRPNLPPWTARRRVAMVTTPNHCYELTGVSTLALFRDAVRRAAYRTNLALCLCGDLNHTSSFLLSHPNEEMPLILNGSVCGCGDRVGQPHIPPPTVGSQRHINSLSAASLPPPAGLSESRYDLYIPCQFDYQEAPLLARHEQCSDWGALGGRDFEEVRLFFLHSTAVVDRLTIKSKLWWSLQMVYKNYARLVMPDTYDMQDEIGDEGGQREALLQVCKALVMAYNMSASQTPTTESNIERNKAAISVESRRHLFVVKDVGHHRQMGITLRTAEEILYAAEQPKFNLTAALLDQSLKPGDELPPDFHFATSFLPNPYLVEGYKINIRRYVLLVCQWGRLRAYVHDDGKNIYSRRLYREPWEGPSWHNNSTELKQRLEEVITSGYVPDSHYDGLPLTALEFFAYARQRMAARGMSNSAADSVIAGAERAMFARLALAVHSNMITGMDLCTVHPAHTSVVAPPHCLEGAIRFQHFGCDFHIDADLTGAMSRLFECNKGPDMSTHSARDGRLKRDVAADIISFVGLKGPFDGSALAARRYRLSLVYDNDVYEPNHDLGLLSSLGDRSFGANGQGRWNDEL